MVHDAGYFALRVYDDVRCEKLIEYWNDGVLEMWDLCYVKLMGFWSTGVLE